jgi:hypothetical protein
MMDETRPPQESAWAPLRIKTFRVLWLAQVGRLSPQPPKPIVSPAGPMPFTTPTRRARADIRSLGPTRPTAARSVTAVSVTDALGRWTRVAHTCVLRS